MPASPLRPVVSRALSAALLAAGLAAGAGLVPLTASPAAAAVPSLPPGCTQGSVGGAVTCTFSYTGAAQSFTVPDGVTSMTVKAWGGHGSHNDQGLTYPGGKGALVSSTFATAGGQELSVVVGGDGEGAIGGFGYGNGASSLNGVGGGGGGGTAVLVGSTPLLVAGAGGGAGAINNTCSGGGVGGDAGAAGSDGAVCDGMPGGSGGASGAAPTRDGTPGTDGINRGGGGGGGGYLGGAGGEGGLAAGQNLCCTAAGGGGGGTSYAAPSGTDVSLSGLSGRDLGDNGLVQISFAPSGSATQIVLTPSQATVETGAGQAYTVTSYNAFGASLGDATSSSTLSISPDGSCTAGTCTPAAPGPHTVTAHDGDLTDVASLDATQAPAFTSSDSATFVRGTGKDVTISTTGTPTPALAVTAGVVPDGLTFTDNGDGTATLGGTPVTLGATDLTVTATSSAGSASQTLHVLVGSTPAFSSADHAAFVNGSESSFAVTASGSPAPDLAVTAGTLPEGLTFTDNGDGTASLAGTASANGTADVTITASNGVGEATQQLHVVVGTTPVFTSSDQVEFLGGAPTSFTVTTTGSPTPDLAVTDGTLPAGVTFVDNHNGTATVSGVMNSGSVDVTLTASNAVGQTTQVLHLVTGSAPEFENEPSVTFVKGLEESATIRASGVPTPDLALTGGTLPDGLTLTDNGDGTATLAGIATTDGTYDLTFTATNGSGQTTQDFELLVGTAPELTVPDRLTLAFQRNTRITISASGFPTPEVRLGPGVTLPDGLHLTDHGDGTATLHGRPTGRPGHKSVEIVARNDLADVSQWVTVRVVPAAGACANAFTGTTHDDHLRGTTGGDRLRGRAGGDVLVGGRGADCLIGSGGRDLLRAGPGNDRLYGGSGADRLVAGVGRDVVHAGSGRDVVLVRDGRRDTVWCGTGRDRVVADPTDVLHGCEVVRLPRR